MREVKKWDERLNLKPSLESFVGHEHDGSSGDDLDLRHDESAEEGLEAVSTVHLAEAVRDRLVGRRFGIIALNRERNSYTQLHLPSDHISWVGQTSSYEASPAADEEIGYVEPLALLVGHVASRSPIEDTELEGEVRNDADHRHDPALVEAEEAALLDNVHHSADHPWLLSHDLALVLLSLDCQEGSHKIQRVSQGRRADSRQSSTRALHLVDVLLSIREQQFLEQLIEVELEGSEREDTDDIGSIA